MAEVRGSLRAAVLLFTIRRSELSTPRELTGAAVLAVGFVAYTLSFVL